MKVVKIVLWSLLALFVVGLGGTYAYFATRPPTGEFVVLGPGKPVTVSVDGGPPIEITAKGRHAETLPLGTHAIKVLAPDAREVSFEVQERKTTIVPVLSPQCFATLDVTMSHYEVAGDSRAPRLAGVKTADAPFVLTPGHHTSMAALPKRRTSGASVLVLRSATCEEIAALAKADDG